MLAHPLQAVLTATTKPKPGGSSADVEQGFNRIQDIIVNGFDPAPAEAWQINAAFALVMVIGLHYWAVKIPGVNYKNRVPQFLTLLFAAGFGYSLLEVPIIGSFTEAFAELVHRLGDTFEVTGTLIASVIGVYILFRLGRKYCDGKLDEKSKKMLPSEKILHAFVFAFACMVASFLIPTFGDVLGWIYHFVVIGLINLLVVFTGSIGNWGVTTNGG